MSIIPDAPIHPAWSAGAEPVGDAERWFYSDIQAVEPASSRPDDEDLVTVGVEQYTFRDADVWRSAPAGIVLDVLREGGAQLSAHEARRVARLLLAAADIADGVAVTW